jgi:hypothetical protein
MDADYNDWSFAPEENKYLQYLPYLLEKSMQVAFMYVFLNACVRVYCKSKKYDGSAKIQKCSKKCSE